MKEIFCEKGVTTQDELSDEDLALINSHSRKALGRDDVYTFKLTLCDNEIDRDLEQFSPEALASLAPLFVGKTGIFDHSMKSRDQTARIFKTAVEAPEGRQNSLGQPYVKLTACAYMPKTEKNAPIIDEIDAGILKEISVGCSVGKINCSVCGADLRKSPCTHIKGEAYSGKPCYHILSEPRDAYEWSFVAVPAQINAGVSKSFNIQNERHGETKMSDILKMLKESENGATLTKAQALEFAENYEFALKLAEYGEKYRSDMCDKLSALCAVALPEMDLKIFYGIADKLDVKELSALHKALESRAAQIIPPTVQLAPKAQKTAALNHNEFKI